VQAEGAFIMGVGALLRENVLISKDGVLESDGTWEYLSTLLSVTAV